MASPDVVDLPDEEAVAHFRGKRDRQDWAWSFDWRDVRALAEGRTLREFVEAGRPPAKSAARAAPWWFGRPTRRGAPYHITELGRWR